MFGYIRPQSCELKVRELEQFKACYCGLCHALGEKYGYFAKNILNYDLVFLAMLLWDDEKIQMSRRRCVASFFRKKPHCVRNNALDTGAGYCVILTWHKLRDTIADEKFGVKKLLCKAVILLLHRAYKKAAREFPDFDANVRHELQKLAELEISGEKSVDNAADKFAKVLSFAGMTHRPLIELLYHTGRWIYIIDACHDYDEDLRRGRYNPIKNGCKDRLQTTLAHSNNLVKTAFELMPENPWTPVLSNTIYLGMPDVCRRVFDGTYNTRGNKPKHITKELDI